MSPDQLTYVLVALIVTGVAILLLLVGALVARRGRGEERPAARPTEPVASLAPHDAAIPARPPASATRMPADPAVRAIDDTEARPHDETAPGAVPEPASGPEPEPAGAATLASEPAGDVGPVVTAADREAAARRLHDPREEEIIQGFLSMSPRKREAAAFDAPRAPSAARPVTAPVLASGPAAPASSPAPAREPAPAPVAPSAPVAAARPAEPGPEGAVPADPYYDEATGLDSRAAWERALAEENARYVRYRRPVGVVVAELDGLTRFESQFGSDAASRVLAAVGDAMRRNARRTDRVAHVGAGRFLVMLPETDEIQAINYVERVRGECERWLEAGAVALHVSIGWASPSAVGELDTALRTAEERMYVERRRAARAAAPGLDAFR